MEQLEFDLWVEERFSEYDIMRVSARYNELKYLAFVRPNDVEFYSSPISAHVVVRSRI